MKKVFISFARTKPEQEAARWLSARLRCDPRIARVFLDEEEFIPGSNLNETLRREIGSADAVVFLVSGSFLDRDYPMKEIQTAAQIDPTGTAIRRIAVRRTDNIDMPAEFARFGNPVEWIDGRDHPFAALWQIYCGIVVQPAGPVAEHVDRGRTVGASGAPPPDTLLAPPAACERSLTCGRAFEWTWVSGDNTEIDRLIVIGAAHGEDHEHFIRRMDRHLTRTPPRSIVKVDWSTDVGLQRRPRSRPDYFECLGRALTGKAVDDATLKAVLSAKLRHGNVMLLHPRIDSLFDDEPLLAYYTQWLPALLREITEPRKHVKIVQPIAWGASAAAVRAIRRVLTPRRRFVFWFDWLCGAEERSARELVRRVVHQRGTAVLPIELTRVRKRHIDEFCDADGAVSETHREQILKRVARVRSSDKVFIAIDQVLEGAPG